MAKGKTCQIFFRKKTSSAWIPPPLFLLSSIIFFLTIAFIVSFPSTVTITIFLGFPSSSSNNQHHLHPHLLLLTFPIRGTTFPLDLAFYFCLYRCISELPLMRVMPFLLLLFPFLLIINTVSTALHPSPCCMTWISVAVTLAGVVVVASAVSPSSLLPRSDLLLLLNCGCCCLPPLLCFGRSLLLLWMSSSLGENQRTSWMFGTVVTAFLLPLGSASFDQILLQPKPSISPIQQPMTLIDNPQHPLYFNHL